jgi:hypothetical protein
MKKKAKKEKNLLWIMARKIFHFKIFFSYFIFSERKKKLNIMIL